MLEFNGAVVCVMVQVEILNLVKNKYHFAQEQCH